MLEFDAARLHCMNHTIVPFAPAAIVLACS
jgi:hypothetical protein